MAERVDIVTFLTARLDEDEATAVWATGAVDTSTKPPSLLPGALSQWEAGPREVLRVGVPYGEQGYKLAGLSQQDIADHIARHNPDRVLRDVAAKRTLIRIYQRAVFELANHRKAAMRALLLGDRGFEVFIAEVLRAEDAEREWRDVLRIHAGVHSEHPDFNPQWLLPDELEPASRGQE